MIGCIFNIALFNDRPTLFHSWPTSYNWPTLCNCRPTLYIQLLANFIELFIVLLYLIVGRHSPLSGHRFNRFKIYYFTAVRSREHFSNNCLDR
jgi:hypothetical protein